MNARILRVVIIILCSFIFFVLLDIGIGHFYIKKMNRRYYNDQIVEEVANRNRVSDSMYHHGFIPNTSVMYHWYNDATYPLYVNSLGLVDEKIRSIPKTTEKYRIVFFGDSYTEGVGYPYDKTFVGITAKSLGDEAYDVLNAGMQRYSPKLYLEKAKYLLDVQGIRFNEAVIFLDLSDIIDEVYAYRNFQPSDTSGVLGASVHIINHSFLDKLLGFFIDNSVITNFLYTILIKNPSVKTHIANHRYEIVGEAWTYDEKRFQEYGKEGLELCQQYMSELVAYLRSHQVTNILLVVYPWREQIHHNDLDSRQVTYWSAFSKENTIRFLNLFPAFFKQQQENDLYIIDDHFNDKGHQLVADMLVPLVATESVKLDSTGE